MNGIAGKPPIHGRQETAKVFCSTMLAGTVTIIECSAPVPGMKLQPRFSRLIGRGGLQGCWDLSHANSPQRIVADLENPG